MTRRSQQRAGAVLMALMSCLFLVTRTTTFTADAFVPSFLVSKSPSIARLSRQAGTSRHDRWRLLFSEQQPPPPSDLSTTNNNNNNSSDAAAATVTQQQSKLPFFLDPNTKGGVVVLTIALFIIPVVFYNFITGTFDIEEEDAGRWIGAGFTLVATLVWTSTYIFRVANKDMTYAKQLKDYENAVIARRLAELDDDEVQALMEDIERDDF